MKKCRDYLPGGLWSQIGPPTRPGLSQVSIGGPFVVRSNPVGAVFDAVRRFCSPISQAEEGEGSFAAEEDGLSTPELSTFADAGYEAAGAYPAADAYFEQGYNQGPANAGGSCAPGYLWDAGLSACVPPPVKVEPARSSPSDARAALKRAIEAKDCEGVRQVLETARSSRGAKRAADYPAWQEIAVRAKAWMEANRKRCRL